MTLDKVHDVQSVFRKMVSAHSFPGRIMHFETEMSGIDGDLSLPPHMILPALVLLDAETGFAVISEESASRDKLVSRLTYARSVPVPEADFILVLKGEEQAMTAIELAREGTFENPQLGATLILETDFLWSDDLDNEVSTDEVNEKTGVPEWILSGPGIKAERCLWIPDSRCWVDLRNERNREFPLGVDIILVDREGRLAALPRTTRMHGRMESR